jgi:hypothetical protein
MSIDLKEQPPAQGAGCWHAAGGASLRLWCLEKCLVYWGSRQHQTCDSEIDYQVMTLSKSRGKDQQNSRKEPAVSSQNPHHKSMKKWRRIGVIRK